MVGTWRFRACLQPEGRRQRWRQGQAAEADSRDEAAGYAAEQLNPPCRASARDDDENSRSRLRALAKSTQAPHLHRRGAPGTSTLPDAGFGGRNSDQNVRYWLRLEQQLTTSRSRRQSASVPECSSSWGNPRLRTPLTICQFPYCFPEICGFRVEFSSRVGK